MGCNIIFVCTSNVCRSPVAEGFAKKWLSQRHGIDVQDLEGAGFKVQSRGTSDQYELPGSPASAHGVTIMREHGVDITGHRSAILSTKDVLEATHIYCVAPSHRDAVLALQLAGEKEGSRASSLIAGERKTPAKVSTFDPEIPDPWQSTMEYFRACSEMVEKAVAKALEGDMSN